MAEKLSSIVIRAAAVLLMLVLVSTSMVTGRYARYTTSASGEDSARVARFSVTDTISTEAGKHFSTSNEVDILFTPGYIHPVTIIVANDSEVAISYTVTPEVPYNNLGLQFSMSKKQADNSYASLGAGVYGCELAPNEDAEFILYITYPSTGNDQLNMGKVDIVRLTLNATQID